MYIPSTKTALVKELNSLGYTYKQIEDKYTQERDKIPWRAKYYARKHAIKVLKGWVFNEKQKQ